ncbi:MAG: HD-GYP domain-containing protein [bacterium]
MPEGEDGRDLQSKQARRIKVDSLKAGMVLAEPVVVKNQILLQEDTVLTESLIDKLKNLGISRVSVVKGEDFPEEDEGPAASALSEMGIDLGELLEDLETLDMSMDTTAGAVREREEAPSPEEGKPKEPVRVRDMGRSEIYGDTLKTMSVLLNYAREVKKIDRSYIDKVKEIGDFLVAEIVDKRNVLISLSGMKPREDYLFYHSTNVGALSTTLGMVMGLPRGNMVDLTVGALLHDIGMTQVPDNIVYKEGKLTEGEFAVIRSHPTRGLEMLEGMGLSEGALAIVSQHHEKPDGSGYPRGLTEGEISKYAQIVGIVDTYEALTTARSYRDKHTPHEAVKIIYKTYPNCEIMRIFLRYITLYPVGSFVVLKGGDVGLVVGTNRKAPTRPKVKILYNRKEKSMGGGEVVNLSERDDLEIVGALREEVVRSELAGRM